ncbi:malonate decarboxylase subunit epsilon [Tunturiibacter psychrotolerans]|uniref:malonate decarboxylase subunit epsilon n=1 Tax=Tunturiibacter psychrotolerans TaxID=3069686 RepID=UPI003D1C4AF5
MGRTANLNTAFLFPGQGAQKPAMLHELVDDPVVELTLDEISDVLRTDVRLLDSPEALNSTVSVQLALLASGVATARALQRRGVTCCAVAGLSVGAFAAAVVAEAITLKDAVVLVRSRAEKMERLYPVGYGLAAIVGLNERQVTAIVDSVHSAATPVFVGNINAPRQIVVAGSVAGMQKVLEEARRQGAGKAELLHVSVPSHCPLLSSVADALRLQLSSMELKAPKFPYIANVNGRAVRSASGVATDLADNIAHGVRWHDATIIAEELGCNLFLEMPPGHTLTDLVEENVPGVTSSVVTKDLFKHVLRLAAA